MSDSSTARLVRPRVGPVRADGPPDIAVRLVGALLAIGVSVAHVADAGSIGTLVSPDWIGWGYRLIEAGGVATAVVLLLPWLPGSAWLGWAASVLLGVAPFIAYVASRTVGVPGDPGDVGNWGYWLGTLSLIVEAAIAVLGVSMLLAARSIRTSREEAS